MSHALDLDGLSHSHGRRDDTVRTPSPAVDCPVGSTPFPQLSASTEEILKRVSANTYAQSGTPSGWEAARQQVLKSMVTSDKLPTPAASGIKRRRRGSKRAGHSEAGSSRGGDVGGGIITMAVSPASNAAISALGSSRGRGRGRGLRAGRGRGAGRGAKTGKRKRANSLSTADESDISSSYTPLQTRTKSGRSVHKPTQFAPTLPPSPNASRKRKGPRRLVEASICKICQRGSSPASNMIVFCSSCNTPYHQFCHDPPIEKDVVTITEKEWLCFTCANAREKASRGMEGLIDGTDPTMDERRAYLNTLPSSTLIELLLHATTIYQNLPLFPPDIKAFIEARGSSFPSAATSIPTPPATNPPSKPSMVQSASVGESVNRMPTLSFDQTAGLSHFYQSNGLGEHDANSAVVSAALAATQEQRSAQELIPEPYDGYDTDPPAHYPKPGNGLARSMRPETEDLHWLVDESFEAFEHICKVTS